MSNINNMGNKEKTKGEPNIFHLSHVAEQIQKTRNVMPIKSNLNIKNYNDQKLISGRIYKAHEPLIAMYSNDERHNTLIDRALATLVVLDNLKRGNDGYKYRNRMYIEDQQIAQEVYDIINSLSEYENKLSPITQANTEELSEKNYRLIKHQDEEPIQIKQKKKKQKEISDTLQEQITTIEEIPFETVYHDDETLQHGEEKIIHEGENGSKETTTDENGNTHEKITKNPTSKVIAKGTKEITDEESETTEEIEQSESKRDNTFLYEWIKRRITLQSIKARARTDRRTKEVYSDLENKAQKIKEKIKEGKKLTKEEINNIVEETNEKIRQLKEKGAIKQSELTEDRNEYKQRRKDKHEKEKEIIEKDGERDEEYLEERKQRGSTKQQIRKKRRAGFEEWKGRRGERYKGRVKRRNEREEGREKDRDTKNKTKVDEAERGYRRYKPRSRSEKEENQHQEKTFGQWSKKQFKKGRDGTKEVWNRTREHTPILPENIEKQTDRWLGYGNTISGGRKQTAIDLIKTPFTPIPYYIFYKALRKGFSKKDD